MLADLPVNSTALASSFLGVRLPSLYQPLRHSVDMGRIFEGGELGWTLDSHVTTFRTMLT